MLTASPLHFCMQCAQHDQALRGTGSGEPHGGLLYQSGYQLRLSLMSP